MSPLRTLLAFSLLAGATAIAQAPTSTVTTEVLTVQGRFVDADTGKPISRCRVRLTAHQSTGIDLAWATGDWTNPPEQTTTEDGKFHFVFRMPAADEGHYRGRFHLNVSQPHYVAWFSHCTFVTAQQMGGVDYGDIRLPKGVRPRMRCVDTRGKLQAGVLLYLKPTKPDPSFNKQPAFGPHSLLTPYAYEHTDIDGYVHLDTPLPPGEYELSVRGRKAHKVPDRITLPTKEAIEAVVTALPKEHTITGRLRDDTGSDIEGIRIAASETNVNCVTRRDGRFTLTKKPDNHQQTAPLQMTRGSRYGRWTPLEDVDWGTTDAEIVIPSIEPTTIVVSDEHGAAVEELNVYCQLVPNRSWRGATRLSGTHPGGRVTCRLEPGEYHVMVFPRTDRLVPSQWQTITVGDEPQEHSIRLASSIERVVTVAFAATDGGKPAADVLIEVITGRVPGVFAFARPITSIDNPSSAAPDLELQASARSNQLGMATLRVANPGPAYLRVSGGSIQPQTVEVDLANPEKPVHIEVQRGVRLSGRLGPVSGLAALNPDYDPNKPLSIYPRGYPPTITLHYDDGRIVREGVRLDHEGRFVCEGVVPGEVELQLRVWQKVGKNGRRQSPDPIPLGTFQVTTDTPKELKLQLPTPKLPPDKR